MSCQIAQLGQYLRPTCAGWNSPMPGRRRATGIFGIEKSRFLCAIENLAIFVLRGSQKLSHAVLSSKDKELAQDRPLRLRDDTARALSTASESADTHSAPPLAQPERRATPARMGNCTCFTVYR